MVGIEPMAEAAPTAERESIDRLLLQSWFSPAFPTGAFAYSHGLETAIQDGRLSDVASCRRWLLAILEHGSGWNDAVLFAIAWRAVRERESESERERAVREQESEMLLALNELCLALAPCSERLLETQAQGDAFVRAVRTWIPGLLPPLADHSASMALPVAAGAACADATALPLSPALCAYLQGTMSNLVWIAVRLIPLGQSEGLTLLASLTPYLTAGAERAANSTVADLGSGALLADLAAIQHETLASRICIS